MKKFLSMLLTGTFLFTAALPGNVFAEDYLTREEVCEIIVDAADDDNPGVAAADVLKGDGEGNTYGDREATKLETFIMLDRAFGTYPELSGANLIMNNTDAVYTDIPDWAKAEMSQVLVAGIADGTDSTTFGVNEKVTETDLEKYLKRVYAVFGTNLKDDFYSAVNGDILNSLSIETGRSGNGRLYEAIDNNWEKLFYVMADCIMGSSEKGSKEDKIKNYYTNYIDMAARNAMTTEVVGEYLDDIENMETIADFQTFNEKIFEDLGVSIINFGATADSMDSNVYIAYFAYPTPNLSKEAYMGENDVFKNAYIKYLNTILTLSGDSEEKAAAETEFYFETESKIALKTFDTSELYDLGKTYNIYTVSELDEIYDELDIQAVYEMSQLTHLDKILVTQPAAMEEAADLFTQERIDDLKNYCRVSMIDYIDGYMGQEYIDAENVYDMESLGTVGSTSVSSDAITSVNNVFSDYIGEMYGDLYCTDEITSEVKEIAEEIVEIYRERIDSADWMSEETKANAKHKLDTITTNIREPERYNDYYADADIKSSEEGGSYFQNMTELIKASNRAVVEESKSAVDKTQWPVAPQTVNACYSPIQNGIYVPIAFLQEPIYSIDYSYEEKLGRIGAIIGHEISHAFDSSGSQYDEKGNAADWWTAEDKAKFNELCSAIISAYDDEEWCTGISVDGELTLTENIADLAGVSVALDLAERTEGFDYDIFFRSYADYFTSVYTRETSAYLSQSDSHSPDRVRVNRVVQNTDKFYSTYGIKETDGMYVAEDKRIGIW